MGFVFNRLQRIGRKANLNLTKSSASVSKKLGPISVSSRGRGSIRLAKGLSVRFKL
jgi:hypothetical protein